MFLDLTSCGKKGYETYTTYFWSVCVSLGLIRKVKQNYELLVYCIHFGLLGWKHGLRLPVRVCVCVCVSVLFSYLLEVTLPCWCPSNSSNAQSQKDRDTHTHTGIRMSMITAPCLQNCWPRSSELFIDHRTEWHLLLKVSGYFDSAD